MIQARFARPLVVVYRGHSDVHASGAGIHGTPDDASVGYSRSHGCIRMHICEAEWLFQHVRVGTPVVIL